jgi:hypothetical protein
MTDIFTLRRALLTALFQFQNPVPLAALIYHQDVCAACGTLRLSGSDTLQVRRELRELESAGYASEITGFPEWYKLADGQRLAMAQRSGALDKSDPFLYGPGALK